MNKIFDFKETGVLEIDKVFFESYYPILFTCKNDKNDLFLCVCCQADSSIKKWLLTTVSAETILKLLSNEITIRDSFLTKNGNKYSIIFKNKKYNLEVDNTKDWDPEKSIDLPTTGEYLDAEGDEYLDEIEYYKNYKIMNRYFVNYTKSYHDILTYKINDSSSFADEAVINYSNKEKKVHIKKVRIENSESICIDNVTSSLADAA